MIGLDTNLLVRYLVQDDIEQSPRATLLLERLTHRNRGFISVIVMVELAWVLERAYRLDDIAIAAAIERLLQIDTFVVEHEQDVFTSIMALKHGHGSFADALIAARSAAAGCSRTMTFDKRALRLPGFAAA